MPSRAPWVVLRAVCREAPEATSTGTRRGTCRGTWRGICRRTRMGTRSRTARGTRRGTRQSPGGRTGRDTCEDTGGATGRGTGEATRTGTTRATARGTREDTASVPGNSRFPISGCRLADRGKTGDSHEEGTRPQSDTRNVSRMCPQRLRRTRRGTVPVFLRPRRGAWGNRGRQASNRRERRWLSGARPSEAKKAAAGRLKS